MPPQGTATHRALRTRQPPASTFKGRRSAIRCPGPIKFAGHSIQSNHNRAGLHPIAIPQPGTDSRTQPAIPHHQLLGDAGRLLTHGHQTDDTLAPIPLRDSENADLYRAKRAEQSICTA
jgi:hypothetical protein